LWSNSRETNLASDIVNARALRFVLFESDLRRARGPERRAQAHGRGPCWNRRGSEGARTVSWGLDRKSARVAQGGTRGATRTRRVLPAGGVICSNRRRRWWL
jgi:hypothetical protein